ncbi:prepilin-type N-terminal cleavage/methylation domain-containing protein [Patescibacteria group bacterium]|nr:prepilin-type N-terminal cleavage/methylation domain-containing protein [Patescibacteria group bacterium]
MLIRYNKGFTLLETLVAVAILMVAIVGALSLVSRGLSAAFVAKDQVTAFYLTVEAVEYIKNLRDSNILDNEDWLDEDIEECMEGDGCTIDMSRVPPKVKECDETCAPLKYDPIDNFYNYKNGNDTTFVRTVKVTETVADVEAVIDVVVTWKTGGLDRSFTIRENMFNWARNF